MNLALYLIDWDNIQLTATESTISPDIGLISDDERTTTIKGLVRHFSTDSKDLRVLDLGALEGGLSLEMAREGWDVTGVEGRASNFENRDVDVSFYFREMRCRECDCVGRAFSLPPQYSTSAHPSAASPPCFPMPI